MATAQVALSKCHLNVPVCTQQPCSLFPQPLSSATGAEWLMGEEGFAERHIPAPSQQHGDGG